MLSELYIEAFGELINMRLHKAVFNLCHQDSLVQVSANPKVKLDRLKNIQRELLPLADESLFSFRIAFNGEYTGLTEIVFPSKSELVLQTILVGDKSNSIDPDLSNEDLLNEFANIMINSIMGEISKILGTHFNYSLLPKPSDEALKILQSGFGENPFILLCESHSSIKNIPIICNLFIVTDFETAEKIKIVLHQKKMMSKNELI